MELPIKVVSVSYTNTLPYLHGIQSNFSPNEVELITAYPAECARMFFEQEADIALLPIGAIQSLDDVFMTFPYMIGCDGEVNTVGIFSKNGLKSCSTLHLDYQSRSSVELAKILAKNFWLWNPEFTSLHREPDFDMFRDNEAVLLIGDRCKEYKEQYPDLLYQDLGKAWKQFTGLPFVFALWVANKPIDPEFCVRFEAALKTGLNSRDKLIENSTNPNFYSKYWYEDIKFEFGDTEQEAAELFLLKKSNRK